MAIKFTEEPSDVTIGQDKYEIKNLAGETIGTARELSDDVQKAIKEGRGLVYSPESGLGVGSSTPAGITYDVDTGEVKISAPESVLNSDWFKKAYTENNTFKQAVTLFGRNPKDKTGYSFYDKDGNVTEKTIEGYIEEQAKAFEDYYKDFMDYLLPRQNTLKELTNGQQFTEQQAIISYSDVDRDRNKFSTDVAVYLPQLALTVAPELKNLGSWNEDTKTVNAKDFYEWYHLGGEKDGQIDTIGKGLADQILMRVNAEELTDEDKNELVRMISFQNTLKNDKPDAEWYQSLWYVAKAAGLSFTTNLAESSVNLMSFLESSTAAIGEVANINTASGKIMGVLTGGSSLAIGATAATAATMIEAGAVAGYNLGDIIAGVDKNATESRDINGFIAFGDILKGLSEGRVRETLETWAKQTDTPLNREAIASLDKIYSEKMDTLESLSGAAATGKFVGNLAAEIVKQLVLTNVVGQAVEEGIVGVASKAYELPGYAAQISNYKVAAEALEGGIGAYIATMSGGQLTETLAASTLSAVLADLGVGGFGANILAQGVIDTILNDEDTLEKLLTGEDSSDAFRAVLKNSTYNLFGEMTGLGTKKAVSAFKESTAGKAIQVASWRLANKVAGVKHTILAEFADWMAEGNSRAAKVLDSAFGASDEASRWYAGLHWKEAEAAFNVAKAAEGLSGEEAYEATSKAILNRMQLEVEMGNVTRGVMRQFNEIINNEAIAKEFGEMNDAYAALVKEEGGSAIKLGQGTYISQDAANYIARLSKIDYLTRKGGPELVNLTRTEADLLSMLRSRIIDFEASHSESFISAAKEVLEKFRAYEFAYMNYAVLPYDEGGLGLYDAKTVLGWRDTGYWGENGQEYVPLIKTNVGEDSLGAAKRSLSDWESGTNYQAKISVDEYSYKPGDADANYLDPVLTVYTQQVTAAKVTLARDWGDVLLKNDALAKEITPEGKYVSKTEIRGAKNEVKQTVIDVMKAFDSDKTILNYDLVETARAGTEKTVARTEKKILSVLGLTRKGAFERAAYGLELADMENLRALGISIPVATELSTDAEFKAYLDTLPSTAKRAISKAVGTGNLNVQNYNKALTETNLQLQIQRSLLAENATATQSKIYKNYVQQAKERLLDAETATRLQKAYAEYEAASKQMNLRTKGKDDFSKEVSRLFEDLMAQSEEDLSKNAFFVESIKRYADSGIPENVAKRYLVASEYKDYFAGSRSKAVLNQMLDANLSTLSVSGNLTTKAKIRYGGAIKEALKEKAEATWSQAYRALNAAGGTALIDTNEVYNYIYKQMADFVDTTLKSPNVIQVLDASGKFHLYEVSPSTATLYKTRPNLSGYKQKGLIKFFQKTNRLARLGNVGFSLRSFTNQWLRDPLNAYVMGGMVRTLGQNSGAVGDLLGPTVVEAMQEAMGKAGWQDFMTQLAEGLGREATPEEIEAAARTVMSETGYLKNLATEALEGTETETAFYRERATGVRSAVWGEFEEKQGMMERVLRKLEDHSIGEFRETYLRKAVFAQSYSDAISLGHTRQEAEIIAEYTMQNATTNFSRAFAWGNNIAQSVPFLGAAINGNASFWRLLEIDPVGVAMRFTTGLVIPTMALVTQSLENETDREVYKSIPEYEKEDNLVFVVDGQKMKIPIPQELSAFISPFRQAVEKSKNASTHSWAELIANDILATSAIDLTGFVDLDRNLLEGDATFIDRLSSEATALISQLSPTVVKTVYMAVTGIDPYTGNPIDKSKVYVDQSGQLQIQDSKTSAFTTWLSERLKQMGIKLSGSSAHALLQTLLGNGFSNAIDIISDVFAGDPLSILSTPIIDASKAFVSSSADDAAQYAWNEMVKTLKNKKDELLSSQGALTRVASSLNSLDTTAADYASKRKNLLREYYQLTQDYQQSVYTMVKNLQAKYGAQYDRNKFAATIDLLSFYVPLGDSLTEYEKELGQSQYYVARNRALRTMAEMGFDSPNDLSIFGYLKTNQYGEAEAKTYSPVAIMNQSSEIWGAKDIDAANILATLEQNNLTRKEMFGDGYKKAKAAGKKAYKAYKSNWNAKVVKVLAPYIRERGVEGVLDTFSTRDLLDNYLFIDNQYKAEEYLKEIFKEDE